MAMDSQINLTESQMKLMKSTGFADPAKFLAYRELYNKRRYYYRRGLELPEELKPKPTQVPDKFRYKLKYEFGITVEEYDQMFEAQNGCCAICKKPETATYKGVVKRLAVDHCHETDIVRGLLCSSCNTGIGLFKEDPDSMMNAIEYITEFKRGLTL